MKSDIDEINLAADRRSGMIFLIRIIHTIIFLLSLLCIAYVYYCGLRKQPDSIAYFASAVLVLQAILVLINNRQCPLRVLHRKFGDEKGFFDLFIPKAVLPYVYPSLVVIGSLGIILLIF